MPLCRLITSARIKESQFARFPPASLLALTAACLGSTSVRAQDTSARDVTINVNAFNERHAISPFVYGGNFPKDGEFIQQSGTRLSRWGGNIASSYNWKLHLHNTAADWYFENFPDNDTTEWVKWVQNAGSSAMVGIAMVDWTPKDGTSHSYSVAKYGPQQKTDQWRPDAGNGIKPDGSPILDNDPRDAYVPLLDQPAPGDPPGSIYRSEWIEQLKQAFGTHPHIYEFDNEPEIWNGTHRDIHPQPVSYAEMRDKYLRMARLIKSIDPSAQIAGPVVCAWWFYWNSAAGPSDKAAHGGMDYLPWWLGEIARADRKQGQRTLDVFDIHAYPDYNGDGPPDAADASRLRSARGLWDPGFRSEGGIGKQNNATNTQPDPNAAAIIPRFRAMVNAIYPGTRFGITEWSYWGDDNAASSLADADTYGIFGREKLDLATRFCSPEPHSLCSLALEMYKGFGSLSVEDRTSVDPNLLTSYAALSADGTHLTVMTVNKDPKRSVQATIQMTGFHPSAVMVYERSGNDKAITSGPADPNAAFFTFKPYSQTLLDFTGIAAPGAADWSVEPDALMLVSGGHASLNLRTGAGVNRLEIIKVTAPAGVTMTLRSAQPTAGSPAAIDVEAGSVPGFYPFTVTARTQSGNEETQPGWIVVGAPGSIPGAAAPK